MFSIFQFHFTYALTLIHTLTTWVGMQGFLRVSAWAVAKAGWTATPAGARRAAWLLRPAAALR